MENQKKDVNVSTLLKSSFWYTVSGFLTKAIGFITIPIFTRILTNEQIGDFTNFTSWLGILIIICGLEVYNTLNRARFDFREPKDFNAYITSCIYLNVLFTGIVFAVYKIFQSTVYRLLLIEDQYMMVLFAYLFAFPSFSLLQMKQRIEYKYKFVSAVSFILVICSAALSVILTKTLSDPLFGRIFGQYILYAAVGCICAVYFLKIERRTKLIYFRYALKMGVPLVFSYLGSHLLLSADNFVVKHMCSAVEVSYLSITHSCTHIVLLFVQTINSALSPWFFDRLETKEYGAIKKVFRIYFWIIILSTFAVLLLGPEIIGILGGKNYSESLKTLPAYIMGGIFTALTTQLVNLETYHKKPHYAAAITGITALLNVGLNILAVKLIGYSGVCYATLICHILTIVIHYVVTKKMAVSKFISFTDLIVYIAASVIMIPAFLFLYQSNTIRIIGIAVAFVICVIMAVTHKGELKSFVGMFRKNMKSI